ncbi:MAG: exodeoxyribonuclease VII large subunit [Nitrospiraceae bacterium]|nr:MAG: exodeoxyribonuclease VII large subunit [Nitrospiraceae bacterium]
MNMPQTVSLFELNQLIRSALEMSFPDTFLVAAEIAACDVRNHCYLTLIEKEGETVRAEIKAVIWADKYKRLSAMFREATGIELAKGIKILFEAGVSFHERYGLKLNIVNIDPSYTIGELAVRRKEILERLVKEGLKDRNKKLEFPLVPQRIGIVSSASAAGYGDLMNHLKDNPYGYRFHCRLYEAVMQGDRAEGSIVRALYQCMQDAAGLDVVVIVRGGGGQMDLHCFDSYEIAMAIASLHVPVISGIGHERDVTVIDEVVNIRAKTPTAVADLIITRVKEFEDRMDFLKYNLMHGSLTLTSDKKEQLSSLAKSLEGLAGKELADNFHVLITLARGLKYSLKLIQTHHEKLRTRESNINHLNPVNVLRRGYSITYCNGKAVKSSVEVEEGDSVRTLLHEGELSSVVDRKLKKRREL